MVQFKPNKLRVLAYHSIHNSKNFENQIKFLKKNYKVITGEELNNEFTNSLVITSDDGDVSFYYNAFPILKKYNIPAVLFVITDLIDTKQPFWWDEIEYYLGKEEGNKKVWEVKNWSNKERVTFLQDLRKSSDKPELLKEQLTTKQLREMQEAGIIIANHSHTHPMFDKCTDEELVAEMMHSTGILKELGFTENIFAYPNGNYSQKAEKVLKKYGIKKAFLFDHRTNRIDNINLLRTSRLVVNDTTPLWKFKLILSGWHTKILPVTKAFGKLRKKTK